MLINFWQEAAVTSKGAMHIEVFEAHHYQAYKVDSPSSVYNTSK